MRYIAAVIFFFFLVFAAAVRADSECLSLEAAKARAEVLVAMHGGRWTMLTHEATQKFMALMNAEPPATDIVADYIMVVELEKPGFAIIVRSEECGFKPIGRLSMNVAYKAWRAVNGNPT